MQVAPPSECQDAHLEKAFEQWLVAALEHGRAQLAARQFFSPAIIAELERRGQLPRTARICKRPSYG